MWTKDYYQGQMLGNLDWLQTEIERLEQFHIRQNDLDTLYDDLEVALEGLWRLIASTEMDWERFRSPLEVSCDALLHVFYQMPNRDSLTASVRSIIDEVAFVVSDVPS